MASTRCRTSEGPKPTAEGAAERLEKREREREKKNDEREKKRMRDRITIENKERGRE